MPCKFVPLEIPEVILIQPTIHRDARGFFVETYQESEFIQHGIPAHFIQDNHSYSSAGVLRGLHFQNTPHAQGKLVRVARGEVFDVAVDIRKNSPTYGKWVSAILNDENFSMLWIPPGFAHGVCVLHNDTHLLYKMTAEYYQPSEHSILWDDADIGINWPIKNPILSHKDLIAPRLRDSDHNFFYSQENHTI